jgi:hypothetical protein
MGWAGYRPASEVLELTTALRNKEQAIKDFRRIFEDDHKVWRDKHEEAKNCKIIIFQDKKNEFRWHLKAGNNKIIF